MLPMVMASLGLLYFAMVENEIQLKKNTVYTDQKLKLHLKKARHISHKVRFAQKKSFCFQYCSLLLLI